MYTFQSHLPSLEAPARSAAALTPNDSADLSIVTRAIYVGQGGDLAVEMRGGQAVTLSSVPAGSLLPIRIAKLASTGTTAGSIIGFW